MYCRPTRVPVMPSESFDGGLYNGFEGCGYPYQRHFGVPASDWSGGSLPFPAPLNYRLFVGQDAL